MSKRRDREAAALESMINIMERLPFSSGVRVLLYVLSRYWPNGWRAALRAQGSGLD